MSVRRPLLVIVLLLASGCACHTTWFRSCRGRLAPPAPGCWADETGEVHCKPKAEHVSG
jgi:hypothetical protein